MTAAARTERMSRVDTAWLRMDTDANLMMIVGVWLIEPRLTLAELRQRIEASLLAYPRFRQKVVEDATGASWVADAAFRHQPPCAARAAAPAARARAPLAALEAACRANWPRRRSTRRARCGSSSWSRTSTARAVRWSARIHHCIGDGIALMSVVLSIADGGKAPPRSQSARGQPRPTTATGSSDTVITPMADLARQGHRA